MPTKKVTKKTTKKVAKKSAVKKAVRKTIKKKTAQTKNTAKKTISSKSTARVMVCANEECNFWTTDGQVLSDLHDLLSAFEVMEDDVFDYHVTKEKNDFAEWVEHVLDDPACAQDLRKSRKPKTARTVVVRHVKLYA